MHCIANLQRDGRWYEKGRTEMIKNNLNPSFVKTITIDYMFEENQEIQFTLYDIDSSSAQYAAFPPLPIPPNLHPFLPNDLPSPFAIHLPIPSSATAMIKSRA